MHRAGPPEAGHLFENLTEVPLGSEPLVDLNADALDG
jgi:hypothetical protein